MPTIRILSSNIDYETVPGPERKIISLKLQAITALVLPEKIEVVEAFWMAPFDADSAVNTLPFSIDVEYDHYLSEGERAKLATAIMNVFADSRVIRGGTQYGVWIKIPGQFSWHEGKKAG